MKRLTERIVSKGRSAARSFARWPTTTSPPGKKATAEGSSAAPLSGSVRTRGPRSSSTATRLLVVPRSMPMIRPMQPFSDRLVDVPEQRAEIGDLREPTPQLLERGRAMVRLVAREQIAAEPIQTRREAFAQRADLGAER